MLLMADGEVLEYGRPVFWNYGFLPQTWADPEQVGVETGLIGSSGPVEVIEIGSRHHERGEITAVRVLGALPMAELGAAVSTARSRICADRFCRHSLRSTAPAWSERRPLEWRPRAAREGEARSAHARGA